VSQATACCLRWGATTGDFELARDLAGDEVVEEHIREYLVHSGDFSEREYEEEEEAVKQDESTDDEEALE